MESGFASADNVADEVDSDVIVFGEVPILDSLSAALVTILGPIFVENQCLVVDSLEIVCVVVGMVTGVVACVVEIVVVEVVVLGHALKLHFWSVAGSFS